MQKNENKKLEKNFKKKEIKIESIPSNTTDFKNNILKKETPPKIEPTSTLSAFTMFKGFYNKNFNLTSYKSERDNSRSRSRSPERHYEPHKIRGNGIPNDILERIKFLGSIFKSESFQNYYLKRPTLKTAEFEQICEYIINYRKEHSELEAVMMAFYFVCHDVKFDNTFMKKFMEKNKENEKKNNIRKLNIKNFQKPEIIYRKGRALSLGFTNLFEYLLKRMEIKYKHIEGYCKLIPKNIKLNPYINNISLNKTITNNFSNFNIRIKINNNNSNNNINNKYNSPIKNSSLINDFSKTIKPFNSSSNLLSDRGINRKNLTNKQDYLPVNHCWNAIYIKGEWYFVDTLFGSGGIFDEKFDYSRIQLEKRNSEDFDILFNPYYFMPLPSNLILTHRPSEDNWQFVDKTVTISQFMNKNYPDISQFYKGVYHYNVELLTHDYPIIEINSKQNLVIKLRLKKFVLESDLYDITGKKKIGEVKYSFSQKRDIFIFEPTFPSNGDYLIKISCRALISTDLIYWPLFEYIVKIHDKPNFSHFEKYKIKTNIDKNFVQEKKDILHLPKLHNAISHSNYQPKIISDYNKFFHTKINRKICYDNDGFFLIEPKIPYLRKGSSIKFKVRIKGASVVSILDGNHLFNLKKTERETYEGEKNIKTDNVSICCLRGKNLFTEVYKFKAAKEKSVDSKLFLIKLKNKGRNKNN